MSVTRKQAVVMNMLCASTFLAPSIVSVCMGTLEMVPHARVSAPSIDVVLLLTPHMTELDVEEEPLEEPDCTPRTPRSRSRSTRQRSHSTRRSKPRCPTPAGSGGSRTVLVLAVLHIIHPRIVSCVSDEQLEPEVEEETRTTKKKTKTCTGTRGDGQLQYWVNTNDSPLHRYRRVR